MADIFQRPLIPQSPNPEPPEFPLYRDMQFRRIADLQADPYGGQKFSNTGRGAFDPRTGAYGPSPGTSPGPTGPGTPMSGPPPSSGAGGASAGPGMSNGGQFLQQLLQMLAQRGMGARAVKRPTMAARGTTAAGGYDGASGAAPYVPSPPGDPGEYAVSGPFNQNYVADASNPTGGQLVPSDYDYAGGPIGGVDTSFSVENAAPGGSGGGGGGGGGSVGGGARKRHPRSLDPRMDSEGMDAVAGYAAAAAPAVGGGVARGPVMPAAGSPGTPGTVSRSAGTVMTPGGAVGPAGQPNPTPNPTPPYSGSPGTPYGPGFFTGTGGGGRNDDGAARTRGKEPNDFHPVDSVFDWMTNAINGPDMANRPAGPPNQFPSPIGSGGNWYRYPGGGVSMNPGEDAEPAYAAIAPRNPVARPGVNPSADNADTGFVPGSGVGLGGAVTGQPTSSNPGGSNGVGFNDIATNIGNDLGTNAGTTGASGGSAGGGANNGQSTTMPWLNSWQGAFTSPMSPEEQQALGGYGNYAMNGGGTGPSSAYDQNVLNGDYLDFNKNPWLQQIEKSGQSIKDYQDNNALRRIQSSMAAGGNAISGANTQAQSDYLNQSGANFQNVMGNLFNTDYQNERNMQANAANNSLAGGAQQGNALSNYFNMGSLPRNLSQHDLDSQYGDWLRQTNASRDAYQYPDYLTNLAMSHGYPGSSTPNFGNSQASTWEALLQQLFGGDGGNSNYQSIVNGIGSLFNGGGGAGAGTDTGTESAATGTDAVPGYAATPTTSPTGYGDSAWYKNALTSGETAQANAYKDPNKGATTAAGILALIMSLLGQNGLGKGVGKSKGGAGLGSIGGGGGPNAGKTNQSKPNPQGGDIPGQGADPFADVDGGQNPVDINDPSNPYGPNYLSDPNADNGDYGGLFDNAGGGGDSGGDMWGLDYGDGGGGGGGDMGGGDFGADA